MSNNNLINPELIEKLKEITISCSDCKHEETIKIYKDKLTLKCGCGVTIYYFPKKEGSLIIKRFVSKKEYLKNKELSKNAENRSSA